MNLFIEWKNIHYRVALTQIIDLSIPLNFQGPQPNFFHAPHATSAPLQVPGFSGSVAQKASCNVHSIHIIPHCNGTHTENIYHVLHESLPNAFIAPPIFLPAQLITVAPIAASACDERYDPVLQSDDKVITASQLKDKLEAIAYDIPALILRTSLNDPTKQHRHYDDTAMPAFFTHEAMRYIVSRGVQHLLVDLPSIDRMHDEGKLSNHRIFWNMPPGSTELHPEAAIERTITELIYVPDHVDDGFYLLNLQLPHWLTDAVPSRPVIYPIELANK